MMLPGKINLSIFCFVYFLFPLVALAGESDAYTYKLEVNHNDKVCSHMEKVYNQYFKFPFKVSTNPADYAEWGKYALPLLPGVKRDPRLAMQMRFSLEPTSPEFNGVKWKEGRYSENIGGISTLFPYLIAQIDINNTGARDTVIKGQFMESYLPAENSVVGGNDALYIFPVGFPDISKPLQFPNVFYEAENGHQPPAEIGGYSGQFTPRSIRPFVYDGVTYLSAYSQAWLNPSDSAPYQPPDREYMNVLLYRGGGDNLGKGKWSPLKMNTVCRFLMKADK